MHMTELILVWKISLKLLHWWRYPVRTLRKSHSGFGIPWPEVQVG